MCLTPPNATYPKTALWTSEKELDEISNDARYFIIRSANQENINTAKEFNKWATTKNNEYKLDRAFQSKNNVILFFRFH